MSMVKKSPAKARRADAGSKAIVRASETAVVARPAKKGRAKKSPAKKGAARVRVRVPGMEADARGGPAYVVGAAVAGVVLAVGGAVVKAITRGGGA